jgi:NADPH2:quinone reductase
VHALVFDELGGADVLSYREIPAPELGPGTALVRTRAIGLNFADIYRRKGNYHLEGPPPFVLGYEGAGIVEAVATGGPGATGAMPTHHVGDRVAFADVPHANAELVRAPLDHLVSIPDAVSFETAAAVMLQGLTAQYLVRDSHVLRAGELAVVHAAAGGVGLMLVQLAKLAGASVLALTSSAAKAEAARAAGADWTASYDEDWPSIAHERSAGKRGADVVYDAVGSTLQRSLDAARVGGHVVFYGMAGGDPAPVDPRRLMDESKSLTGGDLWNVLTSDAERKRRSDELFALVAQGDLRVTIAATFPLARGADAHRLLEGRGVIGKVLLLPEP